MNIYLGGRSDLGEARSFCFPKYWLDRKTALAAKIIDASSSIMIRANTGALLAVVLFEAAEGVLQIKRFEARAVTEMLGIEVAEFLRTLAFRNGLRAVIFEAEVRPEVASLLESCGFSLKAFRFLPQPGSQNFAIWSLPLFAGTPLIESWPA